jgi:molecular chaperone GrpE
MSHKKKPNPAETPDMEKTPDKEQAQPAAEPGKNTPTAESGIQTPESRIQELEQQSQTALAASAENLDKFLRAKAETENIRRRAEIDVANAHKYAIERFAAEMLAVRDSLELAKTVDLKDSRVIERVLEGLDLTLKLMDAALQKFAVTVIDPQGQKFDPEKHQAMSTMETDQMPPNHVLKVMQKGYLLNNRLLRPAMVIVSKAKAQDSEKPAAS